MTEQEIEMSNAHELWRSIVDDLDAAAHCIERAQGTFDDLAVYLPDVAGYSDQLQPLLDQIKQAASQSADEGKL